MIDPKEVVAGFVREYQETKSLDAAVGSVITAVAAKTEEATLSRVRLQMGGVIQLPLKQIPEEVTQERIDEVLDAVAKTFRVAKERIFNPRYRDRSTAPLRWVAAALLRAMGMSLPAIASSVGLRDHTTVLHGLRQIRGHGKLHPALMILRDRLCPGVHLVIEGPPERLAEMDVDASTPPLVAVAR